MSVENISLNDKYSGYQSSVNRDSLNSEYQKLYDANPYRQQTYQLGLWDKICNILGWRSKEDQWREQLALDANSYDSQLLANQREEEYNSASNQAKQLREAGINPDLNGVETGQATEFNEPLSPSQVPESLSGAQVFSTINSAVTTALSLTKGIFDIKSLGIDLENKELGILPNVFSNVKSIFENTTNPEDLVTNGYGGYVIPNGLIKNHKLESRLQNAINNYFDSIGYKRDSMKVSNDYESEKHSLASKRAEPTWRSNVDDETIALKPIVKFAYEAQKLNYEYSVWASKNAKRYEMKSSEINLPEEQALSEKGTFDAQKELKSAQTKMNQATDKMMTELKDNSEKGGFVGTLSSMLMILMSGNLSLPNMPSSSFNFNKSFKPTLTK